MSENTETKSYESAWSLDREIVLCRVFDAPRELVFRAWTEKEHLPRWFGPKGFSCNTHEIDLRQDGRWRFDMHAPDGTIYPNLIVFREVKYPERLVMDHGTGEADDPRRFRVVITFEEQSNKKTVLTMRQLHPSRAHRDGGVGFGAVELGYQTLDKLAQHVASMR
ncbi:MAG TPA: SRPBCC family protein [Polyangiales bacterium]|nr:SRPBCC family protein [Polyangiales bacterium]